MKYRTKSAVASGIYGTVDGNPLPVKHKRTITLSNYETLKAKPLNAELNSSASLAPDIKEEISRCDQGYHPFECYITPSADQQRAIIPVE
jgi:hypothetical protein